MKYKAFISYSHTNSKHALALHRHLENYRVPRALVGTEGRTGKVVSRLGRLFVDRDELPTSSDLGQAIKEALAQSEYLIVICSIAAAKSRWVNEEVFQFKAIGRANRILAYIVDGEPNASDAGRPDLECFPVALRYQVVDGVVDTGRRNEPLAADMRDSGDGRVSARTKLIAGLLGVDYDALVQREKRRQRQRRIWLSVVSTAFVALLVGWIMQSQQTRMASQQALAATERATQAAQQAEAADLQATDAVRRAEEAKQREKDASELAAKADQEAREATARLSDASEKALEASRKAAEAERLASEAEGKAAAAKARETIAARQADEAHQQAEAARKTADEFRESSMNLKKSLVQNGVPDIPLVEAIVLGDLALLRQELTADPEALNRQLGRANVTPLMIAAKIGHHHVVEFLLSAGASQEPVDTNQMAAIHLAAGDGRTGISTLLIKAGEDMDRLGGPNPYGGSRPIDFAASLGKLGVVKELVSLGVRPDLPDEEVTLTKPHALYWAAYGGDDETVRYLVEAGANVNYRDSSGKSYADVAIRAGHKTTADLLMARMSGDSSVLLNQRLMQVVESYIMNPDLPEVKALIARGADVNHLNEAGDATPLSKAVYAANTAARLTQFPKARGNLMALVKVLVEAGAQADRVVEAGQPSLVSICMTYEDTELLELVIRAGADLERQDQVMGTVLASAVTQNKTNLVTLFLKNGAKTTTLLQHQQTVLEWASRGNNQEMFNIVANATIDDLRSDLPPDRSREIRISPPEINPILANMIIKTNAGLPRVVDAHTRLERTSLRAGNTVVFHYSLPQLLASQVNVEGLRPSILNNVRLLVTRDANWIEMAKLKTRFLYVYQDRTGAPVGELAFTAADYSSP